MSARKFHLLPILLLALAPAVTRADKYEDAVNVFRHAGESASFFGHSYGYAIFPTIGKGGIGIGGAHGSGRVFVHGGHVGDASMTQVTVGFQFGGQAYSEIIFLEDERAFKEFSSGEVALGAQATAVAITASVNAQATTTGSGASAGLTEKDTKTAGMYQKGMAVFTAAKGGLMYEATVGGQKFGYKKKK